MKTYLIAVLLILTLKYLFGQESRLLFTNKHVLNFTELAKKYGYNAEEYDVTTEDGYILGLFHIPGKRGPPIFLMHGITDTSDTWLLRGEGSLGINLATREYDVWFGNIRGNKYSRRHETLNPDKDAAFWDYSFNEYGYYDLSAMIDTVLAKTNAPKVNAIGHSQGNTIFYVLGSTRPEYNDMVNVIVALAPICYLSHVPPPLSILVKIAPEINTAAKLLGINRFFDSQMLSSALLHTLCNNIIIGYPVCALGAISLVSGFDITQFGPKFYSIATKHFPSGTSRKNFYHFAQVSRRSSFSRYDYGPNKNLDLYNSTMPPNYDLSKITMPVVLIAGKNDKISILSDVYTLRAQLPNVKYILMKRNFMNHLDYVWGENMEDYLFPHIFKALNITDDIVHKNYK